MMGARAGVVVLTDGQVHQRIDRLTAYLDAWGDLIVSDSGRRTQRRLLEFRLEAPGAALPVEVRLMYRECYRRGRDGWDIAKYHYEYLDVTRGKRLGYHLHDIGSRNLVPHAHCQEAVDLEWETAEGPHHLRALELDLREAHEEFMKLWAGDRSPDCESFRPLDVPRER